jgi:HD-GYP domain-containing protein (c-di-GMP phosphodiesterase class II)
VAGAAIPLPARIVAVADAHSAMTTDRPYREAISRDAADAQLRAGAGTQFDRRVVAAALTVLARAAPVAA